MTVTTLQGGLTLGGDNFLLTLTLFSAPDRLVPPRGYPNSSRTDIPLVPRRTTAVSGLSHYAGRISLIR